MEYSITIMPGNSTVPVHINKNLYILDLKKKVSFMLNVPRDQLIFRVQDKFGTLIETQHDNLKLHQIRNQIKLMILFKKNRRSFWSKN